jgi:hypothetical protein
MVAVSRDGVVGVAWFDGRLAHDSKGYDVYFTASVDGGTKFLPAVRVSTMTSTPAKGLNVLPALDVVKSETGEKLQIRMTSPFSDRATGGDYSSMAVDASNRFHPLWADARSGAWQIYTATIRVLSDEMLSKVLSNTRCRMNSDDIQLLLEEPGWDSTANDLAIPVRILNTSAAPVVNTITVRVTANSSDQGWTKLVPDAAALTPKFLDDSGTVQDHTLLVYRFSSASPLFANSVSAPMRWYLHVPSADFINFSFDVEIGNGKCSRLPQLK